MSDKPELLNCPFCGGEAEWVVRGGAHGYRREYRVRCSKGATTCLMYPCTKLYYQKRSAVNAWNRRATPTSCVDCQVEQHMQKLTVALEKCRASLIRMQRNPYWHEREDSQALIAADKALSPKDKEVGS